ncbi:MAG: glycosyltransferase family 2 protein [Mycobacterium sp.]
MLTASVVIPAFTFDRWDNIVRAVDAVQGQTRPPVELILSIDRNPDLFAACNRRWGAEDLRVPVRVIENQSSWVPTVETEANSDGVARGYGGGSARNEGAALAQGDVIVTFDDDAWPEPDCLEFLLAPYDDPDVVAVGGRPVPQYQTGRPRWFPDTFDWIFGCAYHGLPVELAPTPRLIGANMSVRATAFRELGGFRAVDFDDLDICTRLAHEFPDAALMYEPRAVAHHYVPAKRVGWRYFWTRSFLVNRDKVAAFASMGDAASLSPEFRFVLRSVLHHLQAAGRGLASGRVDESLQLGAALIGIALAGLGNLVGQVRYRPLPQDARPRIRVRRPARRIRGR